MPHQAGLILGQIPHFTELKSNARGLPGGGGIGGFGIDWYITSLRIFGSNYYGPASTKSGPDRIIGSDQKNNYHKNDNKIKQKNHQTKT